MLSIHPLQRLFDVIRSGCVRVQVENNYYNVCIILWAKHSEEIVALDLHIGAHKHDANIDISFDRRI